MRRNDTPKACSCQNGQALAEGVLAIAALAVLFWAVPVIGRYQDVALQSTYASRHAAFSSVQSGAGAVALVGPIQDRFFGGAGLRWRDASGNALLDGNVVLSTQRAAAVSAVQPALPETLALCQDWQLDDRGVLSATVQATARDVSRAAPWVAVGNLRITGQTALLSGAGHAVDDADVQHRVAMGNSGWGNAARQSRAAGQTVARRLERVDAAWGRSLPSFEWLTPWSALVPQDRLPQVRLPQFPTGDGEGQP